MGDKLGRTITNECYSCVSLRRVPGNCHILCNNPDPDIRGDAHGIKNGWFFYPFLYDPTWKLNFCNNYQQKRGAVK